METYIIMLYVGIVLLLIIGRMMESKNKTIKSIGMILILIPVMYLCYLAAGIQGVFMNYLFIIIAIRILIRIFIAFYKKIRNKKYKYETYKEIDYLNRDISTKYPPSIIGYLYNQQVGYKSLIADIMDLYARKIINIEKDNERYAIKRNLLDNSKIKNRAERYILDTLIEKEDDRKFSFQEWQKIVLDEYKQLDFTNNDKELNFIKIAIIAIICSSLGGIIEWTIVNSFGFVFIGCLIGLLVATMIISVWIQISQNSKSEDIFLNKKGKKELEKWIKLKNFLDNYTLIKERKIEEIELYESYIPYSVVLDSNANYKDTKFDFFDKDELKTILENKSIDNCLRKFGIEI